MKKSKIKTVIKIAFITFGILSLISGLFNPLTYYLGNETTATFDDISFEKAEDELYLTKAYYHYFVNAEEYSGEACFKGEMDESLMLDIHSVKYIPFLPASGVLVTGYSIPVNSFIFTSAGFIALIAGLFMKTKRKEKQKEVKNCYPESPIYICPACEREIDKDSIFCNYCGRKIFERS